MDSLPVMVGKRLLFGVVTLIAISLMIAVGVELLPGDLAQAILGQAATPETVAAFRRELGLDLPWHTRYLTWLGNFMTGDMGTSLANKREISELIGTRLGNTIFLAVTAAIIAVPLAVFLGMLAALYRETLFDKMISMTTLSTISFPEFFVAYILIVLLSVQWSVFPSISNIAPDMPLGRKLYAVALPALTLILVVVAHMMRMTRAAIINLMMSPTSRWPASRASSAAASSSTTPSPTRCPRSSTSSSSTSPTWSSGWWWSRWCSSTRASVSFSWTRCRNGTCRWCRRAASSSRGPTCSST